MIRGITDKDQRKYIAELRRGGWSVGLTGNNHVRLVSPGGSVIVTSLTSSSVNTIHKLRADVRRALREESRT